jgi:alpha-galactosidase
MNQIIPCGIKRMCRTVQATAVVCLFLAGQLTVAAGDGSAALLQMIRDSVAHAVLTDGSDPAKAGVKVVQQWHGNILRSKLVNTGKRVVRVKEVVLFAGEHGLPGTTPFYAEGFQMLAQNGGTLAQPEDWGSFSDRGHYKLPEPAGYRSVYGMLVLHPTNEPALLLGFTSCHRFVGRFDLAADRLRIVQDAENLQLAPGQSWQLEEFILATNASTVELETDLAGAIEKNHSHQLFNPEPTGWCSWYYYYEHVTAQDIYTNLDFIAAYLPRLKYIQIDDGYQPWMGDWLEPGNSFGGNVREVIERIRQRGFEPAIWLAPYVASPESKLFQSHPDWFIQDQQGKPLRSDTVSFGGWRQGPWYCLDGTNPGAQKYLEQVFRTMREIWGCTYFKLDANFWGAIQGGRFHDPNATRVEAYRRGMEAIRQGAGNAFILGCNHPLWPSFGLIDGSRSSMDIDRSWKTFATVGKQSLRRNWQNSRLWWNDPDCVLLTGKLPENEFMFHATLIYATGGMVLSGDDLTQLSPAHLAVLKKLLPPTGVAARFEDGRFDIGHIQLSGSEMIALFNWGDEPTDRIIHLRKESKITDFWTGMDLGEHVGDYMMPKMPAHSARLLEIKTSP